SYQIMKKTQRFLGLGTLLCAALTIFSPLSSQAQRDPFAGLDGRRIVAQPGPAGAARVAAAVATAAPSQPGQPATPGKPGAKVKTTEELTVEKFPALTFDRRQSIILKTWASPWPIPIPEPDPEVEAERLFEEAKKQKINDDKATAVAKAATEADEAARKAAGDDAEKLKAYEAQKKTAADAKEKAEETKAAAAIKAEAAQKLAAQIDGTLRNFQRDVTLGQWDKVHTFFNGGEVFKDESNAKKMYALFLTKLVQTPNGTPAFLNPVLPIKPGVNPSKPKPQPQPQANRGRNGGMFAEKNVFQPDDVLAIADASPTKLTNRSHSGTLGMLLQQSLANGNFLDQLIAKLNGGTRWLGGTEKEPRMMAARILIGAGRPVEAGQFLPTLEEAKETKDIEALNLTAYYFLTRYGVQPKKEYLENGWEATQAVLAANVLKDEQKDEALSRAVELAPKLEEQLGQAWLGESFTKNEARGREVLAAIGSAASKGRGNRMSEQRLKQLELQKTAVDALLSLKDLDLSKWANSLNLLALNWLGEGEYSYQFDQSSSSTGMQMQWDNYGNMYYVRDSSNANWLQQNRGNAPQPITSGLLLEVKPGDKWLAQVDPSLQPKFAMSYAQLFLKVSEEEKAYPYIEMLAKTHPAQSLKLANEFIQVWTRNHDPNSDRNRSYRYGYMYGYNQRADAIPLTRSKQARNVKELSEWIAKLRELPIGDLKEDVLTKAFTTSHSLAEVYKLDDIERVFGGIEELKPKTIAAFVETMRTNLLTVWRDPKVQNAKKTKRVDKEIQAEVKNGYVTAFNVIFNALEAYPDSWRLQLAKAAVLTDENNFKNDNLKDSQGFAIRRVDAFKEFAKAADMYAKKLTDLAEDEEASDVYDIWFYAALGASDIGAIQDHQQPVPGELAKIKTAIEALPGLAAERHMARFANNLSSRVSSVKAELKNRYLTNGMQIAGHHKQALEAKKLLEYYDDLVTEIELVTEVDGGGTGNEVGHEQPFGLFVNIQHTKAIERESGGFAKYLQNQNNGNYYNYGRPSENYRDKFEDSARGILEEHFEVQSVTFHSDKIKSRGMDKEGWRVTPYAYILMKAKSPEADMVPVLKLDLDFLDTSGFAVLPIGSKPLAVDAKPAKPAGRNVSDVKITQTLDEREAKDGKLKLEINVSAHGLVPELEDLVDQNVGEDFEIVSVDDQGLSLSKLDAESEVNSVISERTWLIEMKASENLVTAPTSFTFPKPIDDPKELVYQRYDDADLAAAEPTVSLIEEYAPGEFPWLWAAVIAAAALIFLIGAIILWPKSEEVAKKSGRYELPDEITPFYVITLLRRIREENNLKSDTLGQLDESIANLEKHYFLDEASEEPDLKGIAEGWIQRAA
ncbi:MAG: hypothetical protein ACI9MB_002100, partial [Verrucomicrobiales bacterium]